MPSANLSSSARDLHVVVVDDIPETARYFAEKLSQSFRLVTPLDPNDVAAFMQRHRRKVDALVTDLRFINNRGGPDNGLQLIQGLGVDCPPSVLLTASVSGTTLADITSRAIYSDGTPLIRGAMKGNSLDILIAQIMGTIKDAQKVPADERAKGLQSITIPDFNSGEFPDELRNIIANLSEKLKNYVRGTKELLQKLQEKYQLEEWPSWKKIKERIERELSEFEAYNAKKLSGTSEKDTLDALHELNNRVILLDMNQLKVPENLSRTRAVESNVENLHLGYAAIDAEIRDSFRNAEEICNPLFHFDQDVRAIFEKGKSHLDIGYPSRKQENKTVFRDKGRLIGGFFRAIQGKFNKTGHTIYISYEDNTSPIFDGSKLQEKLRNKLKWGEGYRISLSSRCPEDTKKTWGQLLDSLRGLLEKLTIEAKILYIDPQAFSYPPGPGDSIDMYLKIADLDPVALQREEEMKQKIQAKKIGIMMFHNKKVAVHTLTIPSGSATILGYSDPKKIKSTRGAWSGILYNGELVLSKVSSAHFENEQAICYYLVKRLKIDSEKAFTIAQRAVRLKLEEKKMIIDYDEGLSREMEGLSPQERQELEGAMAEVGEINVFQGKKEFVIKISTILPELGIPEVVLDKQEFLSRSVLEWMGVSELGNPGHGQEDEEKDVWIDEVEK